MSAGCLWSPSVSIAAAGADYEAGVDQSLSLMFWSGAAPVVEQSAVQYVQGYQAGSRVISTGHRSESGHGPEVMGSTRGRRHTYSDMWQLNREGIM